MKLNKICGALVAASAAMFLFATPAQAQDDEGPVTWGEDAAYVRTIVVKFKPGKRERAIEIIDTYFAPATEKAGTPGPKMILHMQTGQWDMAVIWDLEGGMADLEWYRSEDALKWRAAFAEIAGGPEEAEKIMTEYQSAIADAVVNVGHYHTGEE